MKMIHSPRRLTLICIATIVAALALAPAALANSSVRTYAGHGGNTQAQIQAGGGAATDPSATATSAGALPFTGLDLALAVGGGLVLLLGGISMAVLTSRSQRLRGN